MEPYIPFSMHQTLKSSALDRLRTEALYQIHPSVPTLDGLQTDLQSMLLANLKRPESLGTWAPTFNPALLAELQLARGSNPYAQAKSMTLADSKDRLSGKLYEEMTTNSIGGASDHSILRHRTSSTVQQPKNLGNLVSSQNLPGNSSQNANNSIKNSPNKQKSDKIEIHPQKELKNNVSTNKKTELIVIDEDPEEEVIVVPQRKDESRGGSTTQAAKKDLPSHQVKATADVINSESSSNSKPAPVKKPENTRSIYEEKIQKLLKEQNASLLESSHGLSSTPAVVNELQNRISVNPLGYGSTLPLDYAAQLAQLSQFGLGIPSYPAAMQRSGGTDLGSLLALQALAQNMQAQSSFSNGLTAGYLEKTLLYQQQVQQMQRMAQLANLSLTNPLLGVNGSAHAESQEQEKAKQFAFVREKESKIVAEKSTTKESIQIIDLEDEDDLEESSEGAQTEKRQCGDNKTAKKVFQIVKSGPQSKKQEKKHSETLTPNSSNHIEKQKVIVNKLALKKTRSSQSKELEVNSAEMSSLDENLGQQKKKTIVSTRSVTQALQGRRKNKLQLMAEERENFAKELKDLTVKHVEELASQGEDSEEEYASLCDYPNPLKRIKPIRVGSNYQTVIPHLELNHREEMKPRKFKSVWNPSKLGDEKVSEFLSAVKAILKIETYHEDFLLRLLSKNHMDCEKTLNTIETNADYFANLFKLKRSYNHLRKSPRFDQLENNSS